MEEYGYLYNKFTKDVKKFSDKPNLSIRNKDNYSIYIFIVCIILFVIIAKYC